MDSLSAQKAIQSIMSNEGKGSVLSVLACNSVVLAFAFFCFAFLTFCSANSSYVGARTSTMISSSSQDLIMRQTRCSVRKHLMTSRCDPQQIHAFARQYAFRYSVARAILVTGYPRGLPLFSPRLGFSWKLVGHDDREFVSIQSILLVKFIRVCSHNVAPIAGTSWSTIRAKLRRMRLIVHAKQRVSHLSRIPLVI